MNNQFVQGVSINWDKIEPRSYLREIESIRELDYLELSKAITFFVGENGSGKSTMLEAIAVAAGFNPEGGTKNYCFSTYDSHSELCDAIRLSKGFRKPGWGYFLRAESFYNVATQEEQYADPAHPSLRLHKKSHGESFLALAQSQFIIVTHSPILLGMPGAQIYTFDNGRIHECEYEDTDSYQVTEMFINNREAILRRLLDE